jgi:hypothetical protein
MSLIKEMLKEVAAGDVGRGLGYSPSPPPNLRARTRTPCISDHVQHPEHLKEFLASVEALLATVEEHSQEPELWSIVDCASSVRSNMGKAGISV